jgi:hypothetical protein
MGRDHGGLGLRVTRSGGKHAELPERADDGQRRLTDPTGLHRELVTTRSHDLPCDTEVHRLHECTNFRVTHSTRKSAKIPSTRLFRATRFTRGNRRDHRMHDNHNETRCRNIPRVRFERGAGPRGSWTKEYGGSETGVRRWRGRSVGSRSRAFNVRTEACRPHGSTFSRVARS